MYNCISFAEDCFISKANSVDSDPDEMPHYYHFILHGLKKNTHLGVISMNRLRIHISCESVMKVN